MRSALRSRSATHRALSRTPKTQTPRRRQSKFPMNDTRPSSGFCRLRDGKKIGDRQAGEEAVCIGEPRKEPRDCILEHNNCVFDILPPVFLDSLMPKDGCGTAAVSSGDALQFPPPPWETWRDNFMQDAPESAARLSWEGLSPEPNQVNLDKLDLKGFYSLAISKSFIYCLQDKAMPSGFFHPGMSSRLGAFKLLEMDGSHEVMSCRVGRQDHRSELGMTLK